MKRLFLYPLAAVAAIVPAGTGLMANGSFSHDVPVRTPERAQVLRLASPTPTGTAIPTRSAEPGDDHGGDRVRVRVTRSAEPGDDDGGDRVRVRVTRSAEPGDDHGGDRARVRVTRSAEPGDDHGGHHRHGSDDGTGHGGGHGSGHGGDDSGGHGSDD